MYKKSMGGKNWWATTQHRWRRRSFAILASTLLISSLAIARGLAQGAYPSKPVTLVLATTPGGVADAVARMIQPQLSERLGQPVIIDNRPGAAGVIGATSVAKSPPDGQTVLLNLEMHVINQVAAAKPPYHAVNDFMPVSLLARLPHMIAVPSALKISSMSEFVTLAKRQPGKLNFGSPGSLTSTYLETLDFEGRAGIEMLHVPYKGGPPIVQALMRNDVQFAILSLPPFRGAIQSGQITPVAVTGEKRLPEMPDVPTMVELGYTGFITHTWIGAFVPRGSPAPVIQRLHQEFSAALAVPDTREKIIKAGFEPVGSTPEELATLVKNELERWNKIVRDHNVHFD